MKIIVVHHGRLPGGPWPVAGVALRAASLGAGLTFLGHEVTYLTRTRDVVQSSLPSLSYESPAELLRLARELRPDVVVCCVPGEMAHLRPLDCPLVADLYAPRLLEAQFEGLDLNTEVAELLTAIRHGDCFLVTHHRQRDYLLGLLPLAGVDCRREVITEVPLMAPVTSVTERSPTPLLVAGGVWWPWQDSGWVTEKVLAQLEAQDRGRLQLFGGHYPLAESTGRDPLANLKSSRLERSPFLPYPQLLLSLGRAWAALDVMAPNNERRLALSFREMDWLGCGVPVVVGDHVPLAEWIGESEAGWVVKWGDEAELRRVITQILEGGNPLERRQDAARRLARRCFGVEQVAEGLAEMLSRLHLRARHPTVLSQLADVKLEAMHLATTLGERERQLADLQVDLAKKSAELERLSAQVAQLTDGMGSLTRALEDSLHFKRDQLDHQADLSRESRAAAAAAEREVTVLRRDLAKKEREASTLADDKRNLLAELDHLAEQLHQAERDQLAAAERDVIHQEHTRELREVRARLHEALATLATLQGDLAKKDEEAHSRGVEMSHLRSRVAQTERALAEDEASLALRLSRRLGNLLRP